MLARIVAFFLFLTAACAPASSAPPHFVGEAEARHESHHTKISPLGAAGIAVLGVAVAGFAGVIFFVVPQKAG